MALRRYTESALLNAGGEMVSVRLKKIKKPKEPYQLLHMIKLRGSYYCEVGDKVWVKGVGRHSEYVEISHERKIIRLNRKLTRLNVNWFFSQLTSV